MKVNCEMQNVPMEILSYDLKETSKGIPVLQFRIKIVGTAYDPLIFSIYINEERPEFFAKQLKLMTGFTITDLSQIDPTSSLCFKFVGVKFNANIKKDMYKGKEFYNVSLPTLAKVNKNKLDSLNRIFKAKIAHNSTPVDTTQAVETPDRDIPPPEDDDFVL